MTDIHYIYFSTKYSRNEKERLKVVVGPEEMRAATQKDKNLNIYFWCYDCDVEFFDQYFNKQIIVQSAKKLLEKTFEKYEQLNDKYHKWIIDRLLKILASSETGMVRDTLFFKRIFAFFLLYTKGGYVLDVNVFPYGEPQFPNYFNYKVLNLNDKFNFQEIVHVIPNRKFYSKLCITVSPYSDNYEYEQEYLWQEIFGKLEIFDSTYYKNYDERDFQKIILRLKVIDCWIQYSKPLDPLPLQSLEYCLRAWPLLCKERISEHNKKLNIKNFKSYSHTSYAIILSSIYDGLLHQHSFWRRFFRFLRLGPKCQKDIPEKYLLHASLKHAKRLDRKNFSENEKHEKGGYLIKELNILKVFDEKQEILENDAYELSTDYIKKLGELKISSDLKQMEWWWQYSS